ncbi:hypothetical protein A2U01_0102129, partial [Trifolium medium]|nr:hypothetical protein [Trifolium medium]
DWLSVMRRIQNDWRSCSVQESMDVRRMRTIRNSQKRCHGMEGVGRGHVDKLSRDKRTPN